MYGLQRNTFFPKYFLSVGDWTVKVWNEEMRSPIMTFFKNVRAGRGVVADAPGVFVTTKMDGTLDVWDGTYSRTDPTLSLQVDGDGLRTVKMQDAGALSRRAPSIGSVYMLEFARAWR